MHHSKVFGLLTNYNTRFISLGVYLRFLMMIMVVVTAMATRSAAAPATTPAKMGSGRPKMVVPASGAAAGASEFTPETSTVCTTARGGGVVFVEGSDEALGSTGAAGGARALFRATPLLV